jgi:PhzF family phenazine biosynthesis protein
VSRDVGGRVIVYQVDAFTRERFEGNPAGVVLDADYLTATQMQAIARELNNSETAFVLEPDAEDHDLRIRFFTPTVEVPSCGHATIAAHVVRATVLNLPPQRLSHKLGIGVLPVDIDRSLAGYRVTMTQRQPAFRVPYGETQRDLVLGALRITEAEVDPRCPVQWVDTGNSKILVGVRDRGILNGLAPDMSRLREVNEVLPCGGVFVFTLADHDPDVRAHARMFAPQIGIDEDPVTGNGNGPLGAYLVAHSLIDHDGLRVTFRSRQGEAMGRPGTVDVHVEISNGMPEAVSITGEAVIVFRAELTV